MKIQIEKIICTSLNLCLRGMNGTFHFTFLMISAVRMCHRKWEQSCAVRPRKSTKPCE